MGDHVVFHKSPEVVGDEDADSTAVFRFQIVDYVMTYFPTATAPLRDGLHRVHECGLGDSDVVYGRAIHDRQINTVEGQVADRGTIASGE